MTAGGHPSRREFLVAGAGLLAASCHRWRPSAPPAVRVGCAAITWAGNDLQAIDDIAALGYEGIQLRANVLARFGDRPAELRALLAGRGLTFVALSSGSIRVDAPNEAAMIDAHLRNARFLRYAGGLYLQLTVDRPGGRAATDGDFATAARLLTEIGRRVSEIGVAVGLHPHMGSLAERPADVDRLMDAVDPRWVKLELDVAHYLQGGGDPAAAIRRYGDRLLFVHVKDVEPRTAAPGYRFVELGRGRLDVRGVFDALASVGFHGWAVVELDDVTDPARTAKASAAISRRYLASIGVGK